MKVVILAGGIGSRISEESHLKPKPMIEIGGAPILWHIMKFYSFYGFHDFVICAGYKQHIIKEYFANYYLHQSEVTFDFRQNNKMQIHDHTTEPWKVTIVDTGGETMTGGRIKRIQKYVQDEEFMLTYGDGVCDINLDTLLTFHRKEGKKATITAIQPGGRFGTLEFSGNQVSNFAEKRKEDGGWINGGFMIFKPEIFEYIEGDDTILERESLERLSRAGQLAAHKHHGFWQCMDTLRDRAELEELWAEQRAPWKVWE